MPPLSSALPPVHYRVEAADLHAHLFRVTLTVDAPAALQRVSLPVWTPGSYLVREFARHLQKLTAAQNGSGLAVEQLDKCSWQIACTAGAPLVLTYEVYAYDHSVRACWLDSRRGFFNGTGLCLRVEGQEDTPHAVELAASPAMKGWSAATALRPHTVDAHGFGTYRADGYDTLADSPVELGLFWSGDFVAGGVPHRFVVAGAAPSFDGARLLTDVQRICETQIAFWHADGSAAPHDRYVFMLNAVDDGYGGLEHRHSTALICNRRDLPRVGEPKRSDGYTTLLGLISHEYFHTWNVKRLRPSEFAAYDYRQENYTGLLWFFEGFTSYYDDLLLRRAGLLDDAGYLRLLNKTINQVLQTPGRQVQSVAQASFDAWVKYYRQDENTPNATVSYYTKGALVALCLDLTLRGDTAHALDSAVPSLDDVMRRLWQRCAAGPMQEADVLVVLEAVAGRSLAPEIAAWVHGTDELPLTALLQAHGVEMLADPSQPAQRLGLRVAETAGIQVKAVLRGGAAEAAGFAAGDEWLGIDVGGEAWRLAKLEDLSLYLGAERRCTAWVARDRRMMKLPLELPAADTTARLVARDPARLAAWLSSADAASACASTP
ncbi:M61 family metallopeptidase [Xylophilus ampelinus]|uniref:Putative metalloprotease with PDZ domain n=1 Tax=Xylophilus ampelinus TaxID=54067 RepID=A0A318SDJ5_9BURK|nr:M61 family metallopeptidase [Xylophilus ampelinus]MCS4511547.1 M61 family metallopeptidase [Xylophilus ampelinus]PYE74331.1 putative metalloprotease with PDZ domain [Xylophilus ampelinus]